VRTPSIICIGKQFSFLGWPVHVGDAMQDPRTCVRTAPILQAEIRTKGACR
jgi:hypothetical protein